MMKGQIARIVGDKGFGFITSNGKDYFMHTSQCRTPFDTLRVGDNVEFEEEESPKGKRAVRVERV